MVFYSKLSKYKIIIWYNVDKNTSPEMTFQMYIVPLIEASFTEVSIRYA